MTPHRYLVIGPQGSGKSTFGAMLADEIGCDAADTSAWIKRVLRPVLGREPTRTECVRLGDAVKEDDAAFLVARCFEAGARIACGSRTRDEVWEARQRYPGLKVVYIARPPGPEAHLDTSFNLDEHDADIVIRDTSLDQMRSAARMLARGWGR